MKILILGGTRFLGRALVDVALERRHSVTLFHRGQTGSELFPEVEHVRGDREHDLDRLGARNWDAVFDTCGFVPRIVRATAERLAKRTGHYSFVSSVSVYAEPLEPGADEGAPIGKLADETIEAITGESYGPLKALCEREVERVFAGRGVIARAGLLVGPHDYTDRFPYWVTRFERGGEVLIPNAMAQPVQFIDVRDVAEWMLQMAEAGGSGTYNVTGPEQALTLGEFFDVCLATLGGDARLVPVDAAFLRRQGINPWFELPLWTGDDAAMLTVRVDRARARGLKSRPLSETVRDTLTWALGPREPTATTLSPAPPRSLSREREVELLAQWRALH